MFVGGVLIRRFDGFRRLCRHAADHAGFPLILTEEQLLPVNRALAALGGPPAASQVTAPFGGDGLPLLLLFLLTQEYPCRIGLLGEAEPVLARLKALTHLLGHGLWPVISGESSPLEFQAVVKEIGPGGAQLRPLLQYDAEGEPVSALRTGAPSLLRTGPAGGPYTLAVLLGEGAGPAPLAPAGPLHPAVLVATSEKRG